MAGKTPTTHNCGAALATIVDGGRGDLCIDGTPSQGLHVVFPYEATFKVNASKCKYGYLYETPKQLICRGVVSRQSG